MKHIKLYEQFTESQIFGHFLTEMDLTEPQLVEQFMPDQDTQNLKIKVRTLAKQYLKQKGYDSGSKKYANDLILLTYAILHVLNQYK